MGKIIHLLLVYWLSCSPNKHADQQADRTSFCSELLAKRFQSVEKLEGGLGRDGIVLRHWEIVIDSQQTMTWSHSDVAEVITYQCHDNRLSGKNQRSQNALTLTGYLISDSEIEWDGKLYQKCETLSCALDN